MKSPSEPPVPGNAHFNDGCGYREQLGPEVAGTTLLAYLSRRYSHSSSVEWSERIAAGHVLIDDLPAYSEMLLRPGSRLVWNRPPWIEPGAPLTFTVLYEDADLLAVNKPAGLPTLPGANFLKSTLLNLVRCYAGDAVPVHRLGRWTSGLVLCAKNQKARAGLMRQWSAKAVGKRYRALAGGVPAWDALTITTPIGPVAHPLLGSVYGASLQGKASLSRVVVTERRPDSFLCDVHIVTGRPHQIRIHLAFAGHPLVNDPLYGAGGVPSSDSRALPGDPGYHLHSAELSFCHPGTGLGLVIKCEPPEVLKRLF